MSLCVTIKKNIYDVINKILSRTVALISKVLGQQSIYIIQHKNTHIKEHLEFQVHVMLLSVR